MIGLGLHEGAYLAEVFRSGIGSVERGQRDAARALGIPRAKIALRIVGPQAMLPLAAFVVLRPGAEAGAAELGEFCRQRLASFKKPETITLLPELPKNPMGKILRRDLRAQLAAS